MNPLTLVKRIQKINSREAALGISEDASWHAKYKDSAYVFIGGIPYDLTEGDLLAVFAQYGEVVDVNLVRDKGTGKSKGFAFLAYEDQRSTTLAVDNLNGAQILGRIIRVDHVTNYKKKEEEDEEERQRKREERGVCRAFQKGECTRGASCKFSHDEQRAANTGWGEDDKSYRWEHDKSKDSIDKRSVFNQSNHIQKYLDKDLPSRARGHETSIEDHIRQNAGRKEKTSRRYDDEELGYRNRHNDKRENERARKYGNAELDHNPEGSGREVMRSRRQEDDSYNSREDTNYSRERVRSQRQDDVEHRSTAKDVYRKEEKKTSSRLDCDEVGTRYRQDYDFRESKADQDNEQEKRKIYDGHDDMPRSREDRDKREVRRPERYENDKSKYTTKR